MGGRLRKIAALGPELLIPGHGVPIFGAERISQALGDTAEWLESLTSQTIGLMNAGATLEEIVQKVRPPAHLAGRRYLQPAYDEPDFVVRNIWRLYGGWYDGVPSHLKPAGEAEIGREVAALAGGIAALTERASRLASEGELLLAGHLIDWAAAAEPANRKVHAVRAAIYQQRAKAAEGMVARGIFSAAARESDEKARAAPDTVAGSDLPTD